MLLVFQLYILISPYLYTSIQPPPFFNEYDYNMCETKYFDKISEVFLCGEQPKPNVDEGDVLFV